MKRSAITYFTNLYPSPWEPTRAAYNYQIVEALRDFADVDVLVPVPAHIYFKQLLKGKLKQSRACFFPFLFLPGFGRRTYSLTLLISMLCCIFPFIKLARSEKIVASWAFPEGVVATWFKRIYGNRVVIHCVGTDINLHFQQNGRQSQMLNAFQCADAVITVSKDLANKISQKATSPLPLSTVYNGVSFDAFSAPPVAQHTPRLLFIGNWLRTKGVFELIDGMALLQENGIQVTLDIVGKGPEEQAMAERIAQLNLGDRITLRGPVMHKDIPGVLMNATALILPSYREGVPNVIMEALAAGIPPIATAVGGIPEIITDGVNGILIHELTALSVANSVEAALNNAWDPDALRHSVATYTWENCARGFLNAFGDE
ncbi:glycosyltransferase [Alteromonas confluentis]|uniref:Glycosyl transferase family 1 domain-containing protein n=1 Tax=Alteromonas confluentis TaxID=1656094 RepID=A0A1E7ZAN7_9ALTE|nr:glycosyltransferase [Alteromonas confluentis]OFC70598.1 hypothetical protein BFC18_12650 [Alteromonas confluentis]